MTSPSEIGILHYLIDHSNINAVNNDVNTALMHAAIKLVGLIKKLNLKEKEEENQLHLQGLSEILKL